MLARTVAWAALTTSLIAGIAFATPPDGNSPLILCYYEKSTLAGLLKCDPPPTLVGAVFGGCFEIEDAIRQRLAKLDMAKVGEDAINKVKAEESPRIQAWILDAQMRVDSVCRK